jgi:hypothetical protein
MSNSGPVAFFVDIDALEDIGREVQSLITALADPGAGIAVDAAAMGGQDVAGAVTRFLERWDYGRSTLVEELRACLRLVEQAVAEYGRTEQEMCAVLAPVGAPEGAAP